MKAKFLNAREVIGGAVRRRPVARAAMTGLAVALGCALLAFGGLWLGLRVATPGTYSSALGSASFQVSSSARGDVEVFIPLADWGLRAHAFSAPVKLHIEPRALNRGALIAAANGNHQLLDQTERDLVHDVHLAFWRELRFLLTGLAAAAVFGLVLLRSYHCRRRWLLIALPAGTVLVGALVCAAVIWRMGATFNADALQHPTYYARGVELIQLLDAAEHASKAKDSYVSKVENALSGFASLLANPSSGQLDAGRRALEVSDLHDNTLVLGSLSFYAQGQPVFFLGDFGNTGDRGEIKALASPIAKLGTSVVAVSGNHDSTAMMRALARRGVTVLTSHGQLQANGRYGSESVMVDGLRVAGFEDPNQYSGSEPDNPARVFSLAQLPDPTAALDVAQARLLAWFQALSPRPDVVLVHENGLAQYLARNLYARGYRWPLSILTGHDHIQHVNHDGPIDVIDAGTVGAGGVYGVGSDYVGLGELRFSSSHPVLQAADLIQIEPVSGVAQAQRVVLPYACVLAGTGCGSAVDYLDPREGPNTGAIEGLQPVSPLSATASHEPAADPGLR